jgi:HEAT repeat protein
MKSLSLLLLIVAAPLLGSAQETNAPAAAPVDPFVQLATFDFGQDRAPLNGIDEAIRSAAGDAKQLAAVEEKLAAALGQPGLPPGAQDYICRTLVKIGTARCIPSVVRLLADDRGADLARLALERIPVREAGDALCKALPGAAGKVRIGIVNSLGERREPASVKLLGALLGDADAALAGAAAQALGKIGTADALAALLRAKVQSPLVVDACLACAESVAKTDAAKAGAAFRQLLESGASPIAREAAFAGFARTTPAEAGARRLDLFADKDPASSQLAVRLARRVEVPGFAKTAAQRLPSLPPATQLAMLALLGDLRDPVAGPAVLKLLTSPDAAVRLAAIDALKSLPGNEAVVSALVRLAASSEKAEAAAAARSLGAVAGEGIDALLLKGAAAGVPAERRACVAALGQRQTPTSEAVLLALRADSDPAIRYAALKALDKVATPAQFPDVIAWMLAATEAQEVREAEQLVARLAEQVGNPAEALIAADAKADAAGKERLARSLVIKGGGAALAQVRTYLTCGQAEVETAALRALGHWPDAAPLEDVLQVATNSTDPRRMYFAVQGALRLLTLDQPRPVEEKAALCGVFLEKASQPEARRLVLGALSDFAGPKALEVATAYLQDPACGGEARAAVRRLRQATLGPPALTASHNGGELKNAIDNNPGTRWTTGTPMSPGQWLLLDLHAPSLVRRVVLDAASSAGDYPREYQVFVGNAPEAMGEAVLTGKGNGALTEMSLEPARPGRYVKIVQMGSVGNLYWSVHELKVDAELVEAGP